MRTGEPIPRCRMAELCEQTSGLELTVERTDFVSVGNKVLHGPYTSYAAGALP